jgi:hypothetical protein
VRQPGLCLHVAPGITVDGRIDLIRRLDTNETSIVDFKSSERAQADDITRDQLRVYVVGYEELTGQRADLVEVLNLDEKADSKREVVNDELLTDIRTKIHDAGQDLRTNHLPRLTSWCNTCDRCDLAGLCRNEAAACPGCGIVSRRVHNRYQRRLADTGCASKEVLICLHDRRFLAAMTRAAGRCSLSRCRGLTIRYGRRTPGLNEALQTTALAMGGPRPRACIHAEDGRGAETGRPTPVSVNGSVTERGGMGRGGGERQDVGRRLAHVLRVEQLCVRPAGTAETDVVRLIPSDGGRVLLHDQRRGAVVFCPRQASPTLRRGVGF